MDFSSALLQRSNFVNNTASNLIHTLQEISSGPDPEPREEYLGGLQFLPLPLTFNTHLISV
jgi:hypothetical protein